MSRYINKYPKTTLRSFGSGLPTSAEKYAAKLETLAGRPRSLTCEACGAPAKVVYDHDRSSGKFRGWLCRGCNLALGFVRESPRVLAALRQYVLGHYPYKPKD